MKRYVVSCIVLFLLMGGVSFTGNGWAASFTSQNMVPGGGVMDDNGQPQVSSSAFVNFTTGGVKYIVASQTGTNAIRVTAAACSSNGTTTFNFESNGTDLTGTIPLTTAEGFVLPFHPLGWFTTSAGQGLDIVNSASVTLNCTITWQVH